MLSVWAPPPSLQLAYAGSDTFCYTERRKIKREEGRGAVVALKATPPHQKQIQPTCEQIWVIFVIGPALKVLSTETDLAENGINQEAALKSWGAEIISAIPPLIHSWNFRKSMVARTE